MPKLTRDEIVAKHDKMVRDYHNDRRLMSVIEEGLERWKNSKDPNKQVHIDNIVAKLNKAEAELLKAKNAIEELEKEMKRRHIKFKSMFIIVK